ncbi:uncharacterized protein LAESUDRAFT_345824 [Laetiporus sulphureus 93-53]|uniref:SWIM-type domain-containing protein n=1 Tax=Laetiporus sulphureus 93-53 TaxID=1314785 RepID=A0A165GRG6_9APHY|nr:uncharacterized protein LAESUDRAFT_345824 [Laetiporus sulphureus 93-53]KZT10704.1 hypothetical protein LAESUDRAFT_345824 [Laetiporus sulphureus 93-53]
MVMVTRSSELFPVLLAVLSSIDSDGVSDDALEQLRSFFPDSLLLAALDLIDQDSVIKYKTPWGRPQYEVLGSTASYSVFPELLSPGPNPLGCYCTCPAFAYSVLLSDSQLMCKHLLATLLAQRLSRCVERPIDQDDFAAVIVRQCS